ncbi:discoidin domain-containing protein [uncultured Clostridium sp.]|uniref:galactose-binding domain-containing protein n=1 Tax=uncultured Clostridium sp. TaxID=59620 RepID=UPI0028E3FD96|nr:discoidin domain-containing protein [uncultured Clostridium sp.]
MKGKGKIISIILTLAMAINISFSNMPAMSATADIGKIEAEDYTAMSNVQTEACSDGGLDVAYIDQGDWMDYSVNVQTAGTYKVEFNVASPYSSTKLQLLQGTKELTTLEIPNTGGWQNWQTISTSVTLNAGTQTLRVVGATNGWNFNWMNFTLLNPTSDPDSKNLALNKTGKASSGTANLAFDNDSGTRWESDFSDPQWIYVDLGENKTVSSVKLNWETASAKSYTIQVSTDANTWTDVYSQTNGAGGVENISFNPVTARYVKMNGTTRNTIYGYSLWDFEVYGSSDNQDEVTIPVIGPYVQYLEISLSPKDLNGAATLKSQNTNINTTMKYKVGDTVTLGVYYMVDKKNVQFRTRDASGNEIKGNPLTFAVQEDSVINVDVTDNTGIAAPTFTPNGGTYSSAQNVTISCATPDVVIKYTIDGSAPTDTSQTYTNPINVANTTTIKAIATKSGMSASAVSTATYTIDSTLVNYAANKTGQASSGIANLAFDNNSGTRWESDFSDPQWIYVDLGENKSVGQVKLNWETASAKSYKIQVSTDANNWTDVYTQANGSGGVENISFNGVTARYVRMYGTTRNTGYGYSLWDFEVYAPMAPKLDIPIFTVAPGDYKSVQSVGINSVSGATIKYTTDGSIPTEASATYTSPITVSTSTEIKAIAIKSGMRNSDVASAKYNIVGLFVLSPVNGKMITDTRTPTLTWEAKQGAVKYEVWVNVTQNNYDWNAPGNLLDRYTKVAEVTDTKCITPSLVDRWTYKWYVVAVDAAGNKTQSNISQFSVYLPYLEQVDDGINIINGCRDLNKDGTIEPYEDWHNTVDTRLDDLMSRMTDTEKINQMFFSPEDLNNYNTMAGYVFSYGTEDFMRDAQTKVAKESRLGIPVSFTGDKIQGWKTVFPTELGLAATRNLNLTWQCGDLQRREQKAFGFTGTLSPLAEVDTKVLYPRFQEGCGENADYAAAEVRAMVAGMQGGPELNPKSILITVKHWPSQGAGGEGALTYDATTIKYHMKTWYAAMDANCSSIMPGYSSAPYLDPTGEGAGSSKPTLDYLRNKLGFKGVIMTDWLAADTDNSVKCINAGSDVMGGAPASGTDFNTLINSVGMDRINEAVRAILNTKIRMGLLENPYGDPDYPTTIWHSPESQNIVNEAARESLTLLKNDGILPLKVNSGDTLVVGGPRATSDDAANDNIANVIWQSIYHDNPEAKSYYQGIKDRAGSGVNVVLDDANNPKAAVVVIGEKSYTHGTEWPDKQITFPADQIAAIDNFHNRGIPVIAVVVMPRPYVLTDILSKCSAVVSVYRPGNGGGLATAQLLFGDYKPTGKLPFQLPRSVDQVGTDSTSNMLEKWDLPYDLGATDAEREEIRNYIANDKPVPTTYGNPLFPYGYGLQDFTPSK